MLVSSSFKTCPTLTTLTFMISIHCTTAWPQRNTGLLPAIYIQAASPWSLYPMHMSTSQWWNHTSKKLLLRCMVHITDPSTLPCVHTSPFGVIPKKHQPGKWRLIVDLSARDGHSVNDFIEKEFSILSYISIDNIAQVVLQLRKGTLLGKMDVKEAFRLVPVHPSDRLLLGMVWKGDLYLDKVLPFGLRTAPLLFTALADALELVIRKRGVNWVFHYVDFIFAGSPTSSQCSVAMAAAMQVCTELGVPMESEKNEGPATPSWFLALNLTPKS